MRVYRCVKLCFLAIFILLLITPLLSPQSAYGPPINKDSYELSRSKIERKINERDIFEDSLIIKNLKSERVKISVFPSDQVSEIIEVEGSGFFITSENSTEIFFRIIGKQIKNYLGELIISGDINEKIKVNVSVVNEDLNPKFFVEINPLKRRYSPTGILGFKVDVKKILTEEVKNVSFSYLIQNTEDNSSYLLGSDIENLTGSKQFIKEIDFPEGINEGFYILEVLAKYENLTITSNTKILVKKSLWSAYLFGFLPVWFAFIILGFLIILIISIILIRRAIQKRKKYKMQLYTNTLPKKNDKSLWLGNVAETNIKAYLDMDLLTTHAVVAGATGGGKSISAQVIIEEALMKNISVIVFDPTAQWSGLLRKCEDKKMLSFYPRFGLKESDAKAFTGNIRQIKNERQAIDIKKYINPGQIQVFTLNKLTPSQIDNFVATVIASIFKSDPQEHPELKVMIVFDEVHRLLPKFGGSGKGFLQIERACREFRKWGLGIMLVSQVLSDFVGEIKANINTEVQMRTRDESDLNRIKTKYGEDFLKSLIKASVGVGMFVNSKYNKGRPYFINFRPILHTTKRLSDSVLDKYNEYGETIDDLEYQIEQLEKEKVDTFDLTMELKLVKNKLMVGNFTVVDIYFEGLKPRIEKQWEKIGKKPKKRELNLVSEKDVTISLKQAKEGRKKFEKQEKKIEEKKIEKVSEKDKFSKIVSPLTFDNGMMVSSLNELREILPNLDEEIFNLHVNEKRNDISTWASKEITPELGSKLKGIKNKED
ncbi:MAG TPA: DUF87 domain-containing protein, partial [Candidatus Pacearchaeota archaeon]|nr:DUF87 domain-containing protein [Candidatus Pacearchaeota archaeon]